MKKQESNIRNVDQVKPETGHINQPPDNACCVLTRITDATYARLARRSHPLSEQYPEFYYGRAPEDTLNLAQYYTGMRCLFGKPSNLYDDWKGSFSFVFQVDVFRNKNVYTYLLNILHLRSYIEFSFRKIVDDPENYDLSVVSRWRTNSPVKICRKSSASCMVFCWAIFGPSRNPRRWISLISSCCRAPTILFPATSMANFLSARQKVKPISMPKKICSET